MNVFPLHPYPLGLNEGQIEQGLQEDCKSEKMNGLAPGQSYTVIFDHDLNQKHIQQVHNGEHAFGTLNISYFKHAKSLDANGLKDLVICQSNPTPEYQLQLFACFTARVSLNTYSFHLRSSRIISAFHMYDFQIQNAGTRISIMVSALAHRQIARLTSFLCWTVCNPCLLLPFLSWTNGAKHRLCDFLQLYYLNYYIV